MIFNISKYFSAISGNLSGISTEYEEDMILFKSITDYCDLNIDLNNSYFSRLKNKSTDPDGAIRDVIQKDDVIYHVIEYFSKEIVPILNPHTGLDTCTNILNYLDEDESINERRRNEFKRLYNENQLGEFLARTFMYSLSKPNKEIKKKKKVISEYLESTPPENLLTGITKATNSYFTNLSNIIFSSSDLALALSNNYDLSFSTKNRSNAFKILINVASNSLPQEYKDFKSLFDFIVFSGKTLSLQVSDIIVKDFKNQVLIHTYNSLFVGEKTSLPEIQTLRFDRNDFKICPSELEIKSLSNSKKLELRNDNGSIILPYLNYSIEREQEKDSICAHFITRDHEYLNISIDITAPKKQCAIMDFQTSISVYLKNAQDTQCYIQYYELLSKFSEAKMLTFYKKEGSSVSEFMHVQGFTPTHNNVPINIEAHLDIYHEIYFIEKYFNIKIDPSDFSQDNIYHAQLLYRLLKFKKVVTGEQILTTDYTPDIMKLKDNPHPIMVDSVFSNISLFNQQIELGGKFHMRWFSNDISLQPNGKAKIVAYAIVFYEDGCISEEEIRAIGIEKLG